MKIFIDTNSNSPGKVAGLTKWLRNRHNDEAIYGLNFYHMLITNRRAESFVEEIQSADAAIIVLDYKDDNHLKEFSEIEQIALFEFGLLLGVVSQRNICYISDNSLNVPEIYKCVRGFYYEDKTFLEDLTDWFKNIQPKKHYNNNILPPRTAYSTSWKNAFSSISKHKEGFDNVRIFALSAYNSPRLLVNNKIKIKNARLLLREFTIVDEFLQAELENSINHSIEDWKMINKIGTIDNLEILRFDFHTTNEMYIFDDKYVIWVNVYFDLQKGEYFSNNEVFLVDSSSEIGKQYIKKCISHFDKLAEIYNEKTF